VQISQETFAVDGFKYSVQFLSIYPRFEEALMDKEAITATSAVLTDPA